MSIKDNIAAVERNIADAVSRSGRRREDVTLIAVCKFVDEQRIKEALDCGLRQVGENRAQELTQKLNFYKQSDCITHFIGQLQSNKIKYICGNADMIQSVDRIELVDALNSYCGRHGVMQDILIQVNIGDEPQKGGVEINELDGLLTELEGKDALIVKGLMCVPPAVDADKVRPYFGRMRELLTQMANRHPSLPLSELSMGMSHDYPIAIEEGATMVRVGTAIFGSRNN